MIIVTAVITKDILLRDYVNLTLAFDHEFRYGVETTFYKTLITILAFKLNILRIDRNPEIIFLFPAVGH